MLLVFKIKYYRNRTSSFENIAISKKSFFVSPHSTGFRSFRIFFKVWSPTENHLEEIRKIEGYTRDVESSKVTTQKKRSFLPVTSWQTPWWQPTCPSGSWKPRSKALVLTMPAAKQGQNSVLAWKMQAFALVLANSIMSIFLRFFELTEEGWEGMKKRKTGVVYCKWRIVKV